MAAEGEQPRNAVAVRSVPRVRDEQRPRRVRGHHLDLHALGSAGNPAATVGIAHLAERTHEERVGEPEVDEPRPGDLGRLDVLDLGDPGRELRRQLARRPPCLLRAAEGDVRGEVAVGRVLRPFELDLDAHRTRDLRLEAL